MPPYRYSTLSHGAEGIRLLRILPHKDKAAPIQCELINYSLEEADETHLYEALSYVWGDSSETLPISVDRQDFNVTVNLHGALLRLRSSQLERIIWIDAICINQTDNSEKERQIKLMAKIYGHANRVNVWLGNAADYSDQAFEDISAAAGSKGRHLPKKRHSAILKLLNRQWFRRIWVLQEVAAARNVLVMCGPSEMNRYIFCLGLDGLQLSYEDYPSLQGLICSMIYIMRGTVFRPAYTDNTLKRGYLAELIDMYHTREASLPHDRVYALLNMSFDGPTAVSLSPNYKTPWRDVFQQLIEFLFPKEASVRTWDEKAMAVIKSKGCVLGQVSKVETDLARHDRQVLSINFKNKPRSLEYRERWGQKWTVQASAKSVLPGDLICHLQGAPLPTIVRMRESHFSVIRIIITPQESQNTGERGMDKPNLPWKKNFSRDFLLVWNWNGLDESPRDKNGYDASSAEEYALEPEYLVFSPDKATISYELGLVARDMDEYELAAKLFQSAIEDYGELITQGHPCKLADRENTALIHKNTGRWQEAEDAFLQVIQEKRLVYKEDHPEILDSIAGLISTCIYRDIKQRDEAHNARMSSTVYRTHPYTWEYGLAGRERAKDLLWRIKENLPIPEGELVSIADSPNAINIMKVLLEQRVNGIQITANVFEAAACNIPQATKLIELFLNHKGHEIEITDRAIGGLIRNEKWKEIIELLFERIEVEVPITEAVIELIMENEKAKEILELLLERIPGKFPITAVIRWAAAKSYGISVMEFLLQKKDYDLQITEETIKTIVKETEGYSLMNMLFRERGDEIQVTEGILIAAAMGHARQIAEQMELLLKQGKDVQVTEGIVLEAAGTYCDCVMRVLLRERGSEVRITEEVVKTAGRSARLNDHGDTVIKLLLTERGDEIQITEGVVEAAVSNTHTTKALEQLLEKRRNGIQITERLVQAAARNQYGALGPHEYGRKSMMMLLEQQRNDIYITKEMVEVVQWFDEHDEKIMALLLQQRGKEIPITPVVIRQIIALFGARMIRPLLDLGRDNIKITNELLKAAVGAESRRGKKETLDLSGEGTEARRLKAESWRNEAEALKLLFEDGGKVARITEEIVKEAVRNKYRGREVLELLFKEWGNEIQITEGVLKAAAGNKYRGHEVMELLFKQHGDKVEITEEVLKAAAGNKKFGCEVMEVLFKQRCDKIQITEEVLKAAVGNKKFGCEVMEVLFKQHGDKIRITEGVLKAAAGNGGSAHEVIWLLLNWWGDKIPITEEVLKVAAGNKYCGCKVLDLLFKEWDDKMEITEGVLEAAARNRHGFEVIKLLFTQRRGEIEITEGVIRAAAENQQSCKEVLELLFEQWGDRIHITEGILEAAAGNRYCRSEVIELLFEQRGGKIEITEGVIRAAAGNNHEVLGRLVEQCGGNIQITERILEAAAGNRYYGREVMELMFEKWSDRIQITEGALKAAAGNEWSGKGVLELLFERRRDEIEITEGVIRAAAGNQESGKEVLRLLVEQGGVTCRRQIE